MCQSAWAAITKYHRLSGLNRHLFLTVLEAECPRARSQLTLFCPRESSFPGLQTAAFSLCPHMVERESSLLSLLPGLHKAHRGGPTPMTSSKPNYPPPRSYLQISSYRAGAGGGGGGGERDTHANIQPIIMCKCFVNRKTSMIMRKLTFIECWPCARQFKILFNSHNPLR